MNHMPEHAHPAPAAPAHAAHAAVAPAAHDAGQQHPLGVYFKVWGLLFVLSALSYAVDYFQAEGVMRWVLILLFMFLKAGLIIAIFMHMAWERLALIYAILVPPLALLTLVWLMLIESDYTFWTRILFFDGGG
ncbi:MAG TPA: cytochrome C oxidase subunit IV family protein [Allosphingosinicella sp.]|nr:cytochrome C oxidase subunit IV family protein [Allosphingosinicella sp.]